MDITDRSTNTSRRCWKIPPVTSLPDKDSIFCASLSLSCRWFVHLKFCLWTPVDSSILSPLPQSTRTWMPSRHVLVSVTFTDILNWLYASLPCAGLTGQQSSIEWLSWLSNSRCDSPLHLGRQYDSVFDDEKTALCRPPNSDQTNHFHSHSRTSLRWTWRILHWTKQQHQRRSDGHDHT